MSNLSAQQDEEVAKKISTIVEEVKKLPLEKIWVYEARLRELEPESTANIMLDMLGQVPPKVRLLFDKVLFFLGEQKKPIEDVKKVVLDSTAERDVRVAAVELLGTYGSKADAERLLEDLDKITDGYVKIAACRVIFDKTNNTTATKILRQYVEGNDFDLKVEAAIALAQVDEFIISKEILEKVKDEPTKRGQLVRSLIKQDMLYKSAQRAAGLTKDVLIQQKEEEIKRLTAQIEQLKVELAKASVTKIRILDEVLSKIRTYYVYEDKTSTKDLLEAAAKGMANSLDPYSVYLDEKEVKAMMEKMEQEYSGIGARVVKKPNDYLEIESPIYGGPAYKAGLRSGDKITEVEGKSTLDISITDCVNLLKGKEGTSVKIKVWRRTWPKEREFEIVRARIALKTVYYKMLPGGIGYLLLSEFDRKSADEMEKALLALEKDGMKALILDLRNNPGGILDIAVQIADKFLPVGKLIVSSKGRNPLVAPEDKRYSEKEPHPAYPIVVLVNGGSASASEIVAGALKVHKRATLVGERTYGKGSVQQIFDMEATEGKTKIKMTIALYYLPDGSSIDRSSHKDKETWGVAPDIQIKEDEFPPVAYFEEARRLLDAGVYQKYLDTHFVPNKELMKKLAENDFADYSKYPGFDAWYESLKTTMPKEIVRVYLRNAVVRRVADEVGEEPVCNFVDDTQLQRAIVEALKMRGSDVSEFAEYGFFKDKFKDDK